MVTKCENMWPAWVCTSTECPLPSSCCDDNLLDGVCLTVIENIGEQKQYYFNGILSIFPDLYILKYTVIVAFSWKYVLIKSRVMRIGTEFTSVLRITFSKFYTTKYKLNMSSVIFSRLTFRIFMNSSAAEMRSMVDLSQKDCRKLLGIHLDSNFSWQPHIEAILAKATRRLYFLKQLTRAGVPHSQLRHFYLTVRLYDRFLNMLSLSGTNWLQRSSQTRPKPFRRGPSASFTLVHTICRIQDGTCIRHFVFISVV